jgi:hypothetical protein
VTLDDAFSGLLRYWQLRPNGGSRAELLAMAVAQGFEEPLLNDWLDTFLQGFVDLGFLATPQYDEALVPKIQQVGVPTATKIATAVFLWQTSGSEALAEIRRLNQIQQTQDEIDTLTTQLARAATGRTQVEASAMTTAVKAATLGAIDLGVEVVEKRVARLQQKLVDLGT